MRKTFYFLLLAICACSQNKIEQNESELQNSIYLSTKQLSTFQIQTNKQEINAAVFAEPFKNLKFNKVIAYDFDGDEENYTNVFNEKTQTYNPVILRQKELNKPQIENLIALLTDTSTYGEGIAACFHPHLGIVFYQDKKMVYEADVCLDCNYLQATTEIPAAKARKMKLEDGAEIDLNGFSKKGKSGIINLCTDLNLDYRNYK